MKRLLDVALSAVALLVTAPVCLAIAAAILLDSGPPVLFIQVRVGRGFRCFRLVKFRTMRAGQPGPDITAATDGRITSVGRFLRRTKLDELPQLWNVLCGDMSLVGPRPEVPHYVQLFRDRYANVLAVRPGLTDPATLAFFNEERLLAGSGDPVSFYTGTVLPAKLALAEGYVQTHSLRTDLSLLLATGRAILRW